MVAHRSIGTAGLQRTVGLTLTRPRLYQEDREETSWPSTTIRPPSSRRARTGRPRAKPLEEPAVGMESGKPDGAQACLDGHRCRTDARASRRRGRPRAAGYTRARDGHLESVHGPDGRPEGPDGAATARPPAPEFFVGKNWAGVDYRGGLREGGDAENSRDDTNGHRGSHRGQAARNHRADARRAGRQGSARSSGV